MEIVVELGVGIGIMFFFFFFKQKTAYEILTCDWSSDVCSSDLSGGFGRDLNFELIEKFPWGTPFAEFSKL